MAELLYERNELTGALKHANAGVDLSRQLAFGQPLATGLAMLARIRQAQGDRARALDAMDQAGRAEPSPQVVSLFNPVPIWRARLLLANGEVAAAAQWISERGLAADDELTYAREGEYLLLARVLLGEHAYDRALALLARLRAEAAAQDRINSLIELWVAAALAHAARGDPAEATASLTEALALAAPERYVRTFADEGAPMARLLGRLTGTHGAELPSTVTPNYLNLLAHAFEQRGARAVPDTSRDATEVAELIEPLSGRELEVLRLLAAGKSNKQIADELVVVLDTVKKHVGHILDKLGASNRTHAVTLARALGLLR